jgi:hypothetical protein
MNPKYLFALALLLLNPIFFSKSHAQKVETDSALVFYLGGQSNMDGFGYN